MGTYVAIKASMCASHDRTCRAGLARAQEPVRIFRLCNCKGFQKPRICVYASQNRIFVLHPLSHPQKAGRPQRPCGKPGAFPQPASAVVKNLRPCNRNLCRAAKSWRIYLQNRKNVAYYHAPACITANSWHKRREGHSRHGPNSPQPYAGSTSHTPSTTCTRPCAMACSTFGYHSCSASWMRASSSSTVSPGTTGTSCWKMMGPLSYSSLAK